MTRAQSILLLLLGAVACRATPSLPPHLVEYITRDTIIFAAVVDTVVARAGDRYVVRFSVEPVDTSEGAYIGARVVELYPALPRLFAARRAVLAARRVPVFERLDKAGAKNDLRAGCPPIFSSEPIGKDCPAGRELRILAGLVREASDTTKYQFTVDLVEGEASLGVVEMTVGQGSSASAIAEWVLREIDGRWRAVRWVGSIVE